MSNGNMSPDELVYVGLDAFGIPAYLAPGPAADFIALRAACLAATGVTLTISPDGGAYRTLAQQWDAWNAYQNGGPLAAYPGTSTHGLGKAVDLWNWALVDEWLTANAGRFGYDNNVPSEGWHYQHPSDTATAGGGSTPITGKRDPDMYFIEHPARGMAVVTESFCNSLRPDVAAVMSRDQLVIHYDADHQFDTVVRETWVRARFIAKMQAEATGRELADDFDDIEELYAQTIAAAKLNATPEGVSA